MNRRRGYIIADAVLAIAVVALAGLMLASTLGHAGNAGRAIAESRSAQASATEVLLCLQTGTEPPKSDGSLRIDIVPLSDAPAAPEGWSWVRVEARYRDKGRASVAGLVRSKP